MIANINDYKRKLADLVIKKTRWLGIFPETFERILGFQRYGGLRINLKSLRQISDSFRYKVVSRVASLAPWKL